MEQYNLRLVFWETTQKCNLSCSHCRMEQETGFNELNTLQAKTLIDSIREFSNPILVFSGGEPLLRKDIFELADYASQKDLKTALATNGTLITEQIAEEIKKNNIQRVSVSLDGADEVTHDSFRKAKGSFNKAIKAIDLLLDSNISTQINVSVSKHNVDQLESIIKLALSLKIEALHFFFVVPVGCAKFLNQTELFDVSEYEKALNKIHELSIKYSGKLFIKVTCAPQYYRILKQKSPEQFEKKNGHMQRISKGCLAGTSVCFVNAIGNVFPCGYLPVMAGNILNEQFENIWNNSQVFTLLRKNEKLEPNCLSCNYVSVCGGCRARAYFNSNNNIMEADPFCSFNKDV